MISCPGILGNSQRLVSCSEWKRKGYTSDGYYTVDPDGRNNGVEPFRVYCDMTTNVSTGRPTACLCHTLAKSRLARVTY